MTASIPLRYVPLPAKWPGKERTARKKSPFKVQWSRTEKWLTDELRRVGAKDVTLAVDIRNPGFFRQDGGIRADARPVSPGVILAFTNREGFRLEFPCNTFGFWQENVHAIALALEALRLVERYEVTKGGEQYVGFRQLPPGGGSSTAPAMTEDEAAQILAEFSDLPAHVIVQEPAVAKVAVRTAKGRSHPDSQGEPGDFEKVSTAALVIERLHGE